MEHTAADFDRRKVSLAVLDQDSVVSGENSVKETKEPRNCPVLPNISPVPTMPALKQGTEAFSCLGELRNCTIRNRRSVARERTWISRFGVLRIRTYTNRYDLCLSTSPDAATTTYTVQESEFRFMPSWGTSGIQFAISLSNDQWIPASLRPSFIVPDNAKIFELCLDTKRDNTQEILKAFSLRETSPFVTNSRGETLLHVRTSLQLAKRC
jgi:hypothetical protein